jgi:hypothetical protein
MYALWLRSDYRTGLPVFNVPSDDAKEAAQEMQRCTYCLRLLSGTSRLSHIGRHLLRLKRGFIDKEEGELVRCHMFCSHYWC